MLPVVVASPFSHGRSIFGGSFWTSGGRTVTDLHGHQNLKPPPQPLTIPDHPPHSCITQNGHNKMHWKKNLCQFYNKISNEHLK